MNTNLQLLSKQAKNHIQNPIVIWLKSLKMKRVKNGTGYVNAKCLFWLQYVSVWLFSYCSSLKQLQITIWLQVILCQINIFESIICRNDELSSTMSWVGCLLKDSELFILFAVNSQILLKISVIPILLTFMTQNITTDFVRFTKIYTNSKLAITE